MADGADGRVTRGRRTRETILDAAIELLRRDGVAALSHRSIAARAGTSLAATTYHFDSLDDLLAAAFEQLSERTVAQVTTYAENVLTGQRDLIEAAAEFAETVDPEHGFGADGLVELVHGAIRNDHLRKHVQHYVEQMSGPFANLIGTEASLALVRALTGVLVHHRAVDGGPTASADLRADLRLLFDAFGLTAAVAEQAATHQTPLTEEQK